ncbi:MAG: hypothetical protein AB3K77_05900 [Methanosarcinaceae archaeon]
MKYEKIPWFIQPALAPLIRDRETEKTNGERGSRRKEKKIKEREEEKGKKRKRRRIPLGE